MPDDLVNNSISDSERLLLSGVGRRYWSRSLTQHGGGAGAEFLEYFHSAEWEADQDTGHGRHYVLSYTSASLLSVSVNLLPLIAKTIILKRPDTTVFYATLQGLIGDLRSDQGVPPVAILMIDGFNDEHETIDELDANDRRRVEILLYDCLNSGRRVFTSGDKLLSQSKLWHRRLLSILADTNTEIEVKNARPANRN